MRDRWIRSVVVGAAAAVAVAAYAADETREPFGMLTLDQVEKLVGQPNVVVFDVNHDDVFKKNHVPGAVRWDSAAAPKLLPRDKGRTLVFYCASPS